MTASPPRVTSQAELELDPNSLFVRLDCCAFIVWYCGYCTEYRRWVETLRLGTLLNEYAPTLNGSPLEQQNQLTYELMRLAGNGYITMSTDLQIHIKPELLIAIQDTLYRGPMPVPQPR